MVSAKRILVFGITLGVICGSITQAMNMVKPYTVFLRPHFPEDLRFLASVYAEKGFCADGFDECGNKVNVLRILSCDQNALAMLDGFDETSDIGQLRVSLNANDDGTRGHFNVCGDLKHRYSLAFSGAVSLPYDFSLHLYLPVHSTSLSNVFWEDQTKQASAEDFRVKQQLTDDIFDHVDKLGCGLDLCGWKRTGLGDLALFLEWLKDFPQRKPLIKNARVRARAGLTLPTGLKKDEDKLFATAFGNDGAVGLFFGGGLSVELGDYFKTGFDVELQHTFGNVKERRIKTDIDQTELLLLEKACAYKDWGITQQFILFVQFNSFAKQFFARVGYQFVKRGEDRLSLLSYAASNQVANTAKSLQESTTHRALFSLSYDLSDHVSDYEWFNPSITLFAQTPFNGKHVSLSSSFGVIFSSTF